MGRLARRYIGFRGKPSHPIAGFWADHNSGCKATRTALTRHQVAIKTAFGNGRGGVVYPARFVGFVT
jgi:hypothetical protein